MNRRDFLKGSGILAASTLAPSLNAASSAQAPDAPQSRPPVPWQPGHYQVHFIFTGRAESTFHIFPDGTSLLLDCGDTMRFWHTWKQTPHLPDLSRRSGEWIARYVRRVNPKGAHVDYFHLSHYHQDHGGGEQFHGGRISAPTGDYVLSGLADAMRFLSFGTVIDRAWPTFDDPIVLDNASLSNTPLTMRAAYGALAARGTKIERFRLGARDQFKCLSSAASPDFEVFNFASNGRFIRRDGSVNDAYAKYVSANPKAHNENGMSCGLIVRYGKFRYYTAGDFSAGMRDASGRIVQLEDMLGPEMDPVTVAKVNHHGHHSMFPQLVKALRPRVWTCCVIDQLHLTDDTMHRMCDPVSYPGPRTVIPTFMPVNRPDTKQDRSYLACVPELLCALPHHIVMDVAPGGDKYSFFCLSAYDESPCVKESFAFTC